MLVVNVAPFTGAWIEILDGFTPRNALKSLPSRERGLKSGTGRSYTDTSTSLPSRERGLKSVGRGKRLFPTHVAPFTGAWIEMLGIGMIIAGIASLPSRERGLK